MAKLGNACLNFLRTLKNGFFTQLRTLIFLGWKGRVVIFCKQMLAIFIKVEI